MRVIGLTGGIGTGKTTAADMLAAMGAPVVDADEISRALTAEGGAALPAIREAFGPDLFTPEGLLDRRALGRIVFADESRRRALEAIVHPMVTAVARSRMDELAAAGEAVCVLSAPLLFEAGLEGLCDEVWLITLPPDVQLARVCARDGMTATEAQLRIASQMPQAEKQKRATHQVNNSGALSDLEQHLRALLQRAKEARP